MMPEGQDPDDLLRAAGAGAVQTLLDGALPMVQLLWQRETEGRVFDSPERKAALDKALREKIKLIQDPSIRSHYGQEIKDMRWELFRPQPARRQARGARQGANGKQRREPPRPRPNRRSGGGRRQRADRTLREAVILAALHQLSGRSSMSLKADWRQ